MTDLAHIAARLSDAQRSMLLRSRPHNLNEPPRCYGPGTTRKALRERGLGHGDYCYLTPLGLSLAQYLRSQAHG
jgi:hypothetical protein